MHGVTFITLLLFPVLTFTLTQQQTSQYHCTTKTLPIRVIHAVKGGPPFDVWMNRALVFQNMSENEVSDFYPVVLVPRMYTQ